MSKVFALSDAVLIGMHSMVLIADSKEQLNADKIAERLEASRHHVAKVLQRLVKSNLLTSQRGPTGGFELNKKPQDISLYDIFVCIEGEIEESHCMLDVKVCPNNKCLLGKFGSKATADFIKYLKENKLKDYL
jgi:Rrf2 family protein